MTTDTTTLFPAGTGVSHLAVYDWSGPDGQPGGSAHVHLACTEGYVVLGGRGRLQTLGPDGFAETRLEPLAVVWFSPGVIHRLVNDGDLRILVVMQNSGLPEAGDSVLTFPPEYLADPRVYDAAASPPELAAALAAELAEPSVVAARRRAALAVEGFLGLRQRFSLHGPSALEDFYASAAALVRPRLSAWREVWERGPLEAARRTGEQLEALGRGDHEHLRDGRLTALPPPPDRRYGLCGRLATYDTR